MNRKRLVVGLILLLIGTSIIPITAQNVEKSSQSASRGNWLYVGGSGSGNYSKIQDAINDSHEGDTVFVYSGIYKERIVIPKAISLIGESKNTTIIDTVPTEYVRINLKSSNITISGFTILFSDVGVVISKDYSPPIQNITISDNIFNGTINAKYPVIKFYGCDFCTITQNTFNTHSWVDIELYSASNCDISDNLIKSDKRDSDSIILTYISQSRISNNTIISQYDGLRIIESNSNTISNNYFFNNSRAIYLKGYSKNNSIIANVIDNPPLSFLKNNGEVVGIFLIDSNFYTRVEKNIISHYRCGIIIEDSYSSNISMNTFMNNIVSARFSNIYYSNTIWNQNYWDRPRVLPKPIFGMEKIYQVLPHFVQFDWRPAQKPYDIPGMK